MERHRHIGLGPAVLSYRHASRRNQGNFHQFDQRENYCRRNCDRVLLLGGVGAGDAADRGAAGVLSGSSGHVHGGVAYSAGAGLAADRADSGAAITWEQAQKQLKRPA